MLRPGDVLLVVGREERIHQLAEIGLESGAGLREQPLSAHGVTLVELVTAPHSTAVGKTLKEIEFRRATGFTVLALRRGERSFRTDVGDIPLVLGDTLLVVGSSERLAALRRQPAFFLIEPNPSGQPLDRRRVGLASAITLLAIGASIAGAPTFLAMFCGALLLILLRVLSMEEAYHAVEWSVIFQVAGMVALSQAMVQTGLSTLVGGLLLRLSAPFGALGLAGGSFLLAALLTQFMGGQVTALVVGPVVISSALAVGVNPQAVAVAAAIGCSASFLTPMAHPVNILMMAPGNYRFGDFFRVGWPLMLICFGMLLVGMRLFWGL
jgi:di/tricarboxylate transporter